MSLSYLGKEKRATRTMPIPRDQQVSHALPRPRHAALRVPPASGLSSLPGSTQDEARGGQGAIMEVPGSSILPATKAVAGAIDSVRCL